MGGPIPACAGQPAPCITWRTSCTAYPRVCGATVLVMVFLPLKKGLSPRVRGNRSQVALYFAIFGPIPACAGQPLAFCWHHAPDWAYPRVCGATKQRGSNQRLDTGLSPRVRGNQDKCYGGLGYPGPIPACAGQPTLKGAGHCANGAYPRVCGATASIISELKRREGLSPRVRGNQRRALLSGQRRGPIPACAGQPAPVCLSCGPCWAYPRVCGATPQI